MAVLPAAHQVSHGQAKPPGTVGPQELALERSTSVLAWSLSFRCSIFTLRNLWEKMLRQLCLLHGHAMALGPRGT